MKCNLNAVIKETKRHQLYYKTKQFYRNKKGGQQDE